MKNLLALILVLVITSMPTEAIRLRIIDNGDGTCGIWSSGYNNPGDDMFFALTTASPPYPTVGGGSVQPGAPAATQINGSDTPMGGAVLNGFPLPPGEDGVWGYIGDPFGVPVPAGIYIDDIQVWLGAHVKLYNFSEFCIVFWCPLEDYCTLGNCLIGGIAHVNEYADWVAWGRPDCWCYARQCRGDINGLKTGPYWVQLLDLQLFAQAYLKNDADLDKIAGGICSDINHRKMGPFRINLSDLQELANYYLKPEAQVPMCDQAPLTTGPYNFWTVPPP
jgi:hypothetical protein